MSKPQKKINGNIVQFNVSPKGHYESFMVRNGEKLVQVNFPRGAGPGAADAMKVGGLVAILAVALEDENGSDHPVYELVIDDRSTLSGKVARINFAKHGEPNGAILETGEFVHMKPHGAKAAKLKLGLELKVVGDIRVSPDGFTVIEAENSLF